MIVEIETKNIRIDGAGVPQADFEILLRFVCEFVVRVAGVEVFREVEFPFVEFASEVAAWVRAGAREDFNFESMDSPLPGLFYFHRTAHDMWTIGSMVPGGPPPGNVSSEELRRGVDSFLASVALAADAFGVDVRRFVETMPQETSKLT